MQMLPQETLIWSGRPSWRAALSFHAKGIALSGMALGLVLVLRWAGVGLSLYWGVLVLVVGAALTIAASFVLRYFTQYTITTKRLHIRRGILSKTETSANVDRVQNITVLQSPVDRIFKVGTIDFDTASDDASDRFSFGGVDGPQDLTERIMRARDDEKSGHSEDGQGGLG